MNWHWMITALCGKGSRRWNTQSAIGSQRKNSSLHIKHLFEQNVELCSEYLFARAKGGQIFQKKSRTDATAKECRKLTLRGHICLTQGTEPCLAWEGFKQSDEWYWERNCGGSEAEMERGESQNL